MLKEILESIHDGAVDAIVTIDRLGIIQTVNPATTKMFGFQPSEMVGHNVNLLMPAELAQNHDRYIADYLATGLPKIIGSGREIVARRKDGSEFPIHLAVSEIRLDKGVVFAGFIRDLSQYKMNEAQMQQKLLINERLAAIGQTVSGLAHESRNAFQRSHACLEELALDLAAMPDSLTLVRKVQKALDDLHTMLEEVRCYAAPIILERRHCNFLTLIKEAWQHLLDARGNEEPPEISFIITDNFPQQSWVDRDRIKQVLLNLLDNAWFACKDPRKIEVRLGVASAKDVPDQEFGGGTEANNPTDQSVRIEVCDSGAGIPIDDHEKVFEPFFTTKTRGTGLGLALCRRYIEAHEGRIFSTGNAQGGACIVIEIPIMQPAARALR